MAPEKQTAALAPHVVILGGGFGGLAAAKALDDARIQVTLIDRRNHHLFQPLLYQVATAGLSSEQIAFPIRSVLRRQQNTTVLMAEVTGIDRDAKTVAIVDAEGERRISFDYLIVATGARHSYFGRNDWEHRAPGLKDVEDAAAIREQILTAFEEAEAASKNIDLAYWLTFVIVGAGPTGVELAGAIAELSRRALRRDFRHIEPQEARIVLVEAGPRILPSFPEELSAKARVSLEKLGVEIIEGAAVEEMSEGGVTIAGAFLPARTVIWAAGVEASPAARWLGAASDKAGRIVVEKDCSIDGSPNIFVIGDVARYALGDAPLPGVAPVAMQQGRYVAQVIRADLVSDARPAFRYIDKGNLATLGRFAAVGSFRDFKFSGPFAWLIWAAVHIYYLVGFRNRYLVLTQWVFSYLTYQRGARLIARPANEVLMPPPSGRSRAARDERPPLSQVPVPSTARP